LKTLSHHDGDIVSQYENNYTEQINAQVKRFSEIVKEEQAKYVENLDKTKLELISQCFTYTLAEYRKEVREIV
jgi:hypothetical protein